MAGFFVGVKVGEHCGNVVCFETVFGFNNIVGIEKANFAENVVAPSEDYGYVWGGCGVHEVYYSSILGLDCFNVFYGETFAHILGSFFQQPEHSVYFPCVRCVRQKCGGVR